MSRSKKVIAASQHFVGAKQCLFGADDTSRGFNGPLGIETQMHRKMGVRNRHWSWNARVAEIGNKWDADVRNGTIPMVSLGGQGYSESLVQDIGAGKHDAYWASLFQRLTQPGLFRPWMEMNGGHNSYSASAASYVKMWTHVHGVYLAEGHHTLTWIFCPQVQDKSVENWTKFYPGDGLVDWMGYDLYRHFFSSAQPFLDFANLHHKPFSICESGFEQGTVVTDPTTRHKGDKDGSVTGTSLINQTRLDVKAHPNTVMYLVWNNQGPGGTDFIDTSKRSLEQYQQFALDPYYAFGL